MEKLIEEYKEIRSKILAYSYAQYMINWDTETEAPEGCFKDRAKYMGILSKEEYNIRNSEKFISLLSKLNGKVLDKDLLFEIKNVKEENDKFCKIPMMEYVRYNELLADSSNIWTKAKHTNDYDLFKPILKEIINYKRKYIKYINTNELKGYDVLLDEFEKGMTIKDYDKFFLELKMNLVPFIKKVILKNNNENKITNKLFCVNKQKEFVKYLSAVLCFDYKRGVVKESEHPFTSGFGSNDVRYTIHYYENNLLSSIFSSLHEGGHALYEQQVDEKYNNTFLAGGASMAMHESQSRFYENIVGRSYSFWEKHYDSLKKIFKEELKNLSLKDFYKSINEVKKSFIRVEADELTYSIHIMLRYDLEKELLNGSLEVDDLPKRWNELFYEYFNIVVPNDSLGVLQDVHWSAGLFGYFPTYALGSAYASQIANKMNDDFDLYESLKKGNTKKINEWLKNNIHKDGASMYAKDILYKATTKEFDAKHYIEYLTSKYSSIYNL